MEDVFSIKARHGHYQNKGFWWIEPVRVDGRPSMFMVMFGSDRIGDKACFRVGKGAEQWFDADCASRDEIIRKGKQLIREKLKGRKVALPDGEPYKWD